MERVLFGPAPFRRQQAYPECSQSPRRVGRHQGGGRCGDQPSRQCYRRPPRPPSLTSCLDSGVRRDDAESEERDVRRYRNPGRTRRGRRGSILRVTDQARASQPTITMPSTKTRSGPRGRRSGGRSDRTRWLARLGRIRPRSLSYAQSGTASTRLSLVGVGAPDRPSGRGWWIGCAGAPDSWEGRSPHTYHAHPRPSRRSPSRSLAFYRVSNYQYGVPGRP